MFSRETSTHTCTATQLIWVLAIGLCWVALPCTLPGAIQITQSVQSAGPPALGSSNSLLFCLQSMHHSGWNSPASSSIKMTFFPQDKSHSYLVVMLRAWLAQNFKASWDVLWNTSRPLAASTEAYHLLRSSVTSASALQVSRVPHGILNDTRCCWCSGQRIKPWLTLRSGEDSH